MDEIIEKIRELILKWKEREADMLTDYHKWGYGATELLTLRVCIADLQTLYAELVD